MVDHSSPFKNFRLDIDEARRQIAQQPAQPGPKNHFPSAPGLGPHLSAAYEEAKAGKRQLNADEMIDLLLVANEQLQRTMEKLAATVSRLVELQEQRQQ